MRFSLEDVRNALRQNCEEAGGQAAWCRESGASQPYVSDVLAGRRDPSDGLLGRMGYRRVTYYEKVKKGDDT